MKGLQLIEHRLQLVVKGGRCALHKLGSLVKLLLHLMIVIHKPCAGQRLNTPYAGCNPRLGYDLECRDCAGVRHMSSAAQLGGEVSHPYHAHTLAVLFSEQRHSPCLFRFLKAHNIRYNRKGSRNLIIYHFFNCRNLIRSHSGEMGKVKTESVFCHKGARLLYVSAENRAQGLVKQVCGRVVSGRELSVLLIHGERHLIAYLEHSLCDSSHMAYLASLELDCILYLKGAVLCGDHADICLLSAHGGVEGGFLHNNRSVLSVRQSLHKLVLRGEYGDLRLMHQPVVPHKLCGDSRIDGLVNRHVCSHIVCGLSGCPGRILLLLHAGSKALLVYGEVSLLQNLLGQIHREAVGVIELERVLAGEYLLTLLCHLRLHLI